MPGPAAPRRYRGAMIDRQATPRSLRSVVASRSFLVDVALLFVLIVVPTIARDGSRHGGASAVAEVVAAVIAVPLILLRRRRPVPCLAVGVVAAAIVTAIAHHPTAIVPAVVVLLFTVGSRCDRRTALISGGLTVLTMYASIAVFAHRGGFGAAAFAVVAWTGLALAAGDAVRSRRAYIAAIEERARRAEESRDEEARRRVVEERLRIARELHDVVAHRMAVINVQAGVAAHLMRTKPAEAEQALAVVRSSAGSVLDELGGMLSVLRGPDDPDDADAPVEPAPTLAALPALVDSFTAAGLEVRWESSGTPRPLSESAQLTLYRLVQESLTNAHKYGDGHAVLQVSSTAERFSVTIENRLGQPVPAEPTGRGFGLLGMRERVAAAGGVLEAGPTTDGSFRVACSLPIPALGNPR